MDSCKPHNRSTAHATGVLCICGKSGWLRRSNGQRLADNCRIPPSDQHYWAEYSLHLLHAGLERLITLIAARRELAIITVTTVDTLGLRSERLVHQGNPTLIAEEACLVPVLFCESKSKRLVSLLNTPEISQNPERDGSVQIVHIPLYDRS